MRVRWGGNRGSSRHVLSWCQVLVLVWAVEVDVLHGVYLWGALTMRGCQYQVGSDCRVPFSEFCKVDNFQNAKKGPQRWPSSSSAHVQKSFARETSNTSMSGLFLGLRIKVIIRTATIRFLVP